MQIHKATTVHLDELAGLFNQYRVYYGKASDIAAARTFLAERMSRNESEIFVAAGETGQLFGFTQLYPLFSSTRMKRLWLLNDLFVTPEARGKGISKLLLNAAKDLCRQTDGCALTLETAKDNDIGNRLYLQEGFELNADFNFYNWNNNSGQQEGSAFF